MIVTEAQNKLEITKKITYVKKIAQVERVEILVSAESEILGQKKRITKRLEENHGKNLSQQNEGRLKKATNGNRRWGGGGGVA